MGGAMLPGIRAVVAAVLAAAVLLTVAFGAVAMFRVAQDSRGALQAELARRGQAAPPVKTAQGTVMVVDTPGPHVAPFPPLPVVEVRDAPIAAELHDVPAPVVAVASPPAPAVADTAPASP